MGVQTWALPILLALVVDGAAAVDALALDGDRPGLETGAPLVGEPAYHVAVTVEQHGRQRRVLDPFGEQEGAAGRVLVLEDLGRVAHAPEGRHHLVGQVAAQVRVSLRLLALGRDRHIAAQVGEEGAVVPQALRTGDGFGTVGHTRTPSEAAAEAVRSRLTANRRRCQSGPRIGRAITELRRRPAPSQIGKAA